jgi:DNA-directed RNA polymerase specialized sigma24 family protein
MCSKQKTETEIGRAIQEAIRAAKEYQKSKTLENERRYRELFEPIFNYFYRPVLKRVIGIIIGWGGTREDAEDICQEIFLEIWQNLHKFK